MVQKLNKTIMNDIEFCAAQYLPPHFRRCNNLHGHNYRVKDLTVWTSKVVDFAKLNEVVMRLDHMILSPERHKPFWEKVQELRNSFGEPSLPQFHCIYLPVKEMTAESMSNYIRDQLLIDGVEKVEFKLYETENCAAIADADTL